MVAGGTAVDRRRALGEVAVPTARPHLHHTQGPTARYERGASSGKTRALASTLFPSGEGARRDGVDGSVPFGLQHVVDLSVEDARWESAVPGLEALVTRAVEAGLTVAPSPPTEPVEVSVLLTDDAAVRELNRSWRGKDRPTNVLSFPAAPQPRHAGAALPLGDVVLAYETLVRESVEQSKPLQNHLVHLLVHGTLHCLGHDHETGAAEADAMEALEVAALARLGIPDPYGDRADDA